MSSILARIKIKLCREFHSSTDVWIGVLMPTEGRRKDSNGGNELAKINSGKGIPEETEFIMR